MKPKKLFIAISGLILLSICVLVYVIKSPNMQKQAINEKKKIKQIFKAYGKIDQIQVTQKEQGIEVAVNVLGPIEGKYFLKLNLESVGYVKSPVLEFSEEVLLNLKQQIFYFYVPFDRLASAYRSQLLNYIPFFEREFHIDEYIQVDASLQLREHQDLSENTIDTVQWPENKQSGMLRFVFSCFKEDCHVLQEDHKDSISENNFVNK